MTVQITIAGESIKEIIDQAAAIVSGYQDKGTLRTEGIVAALPTQAQAIAKKEASKASQTTQEEQAVSTATTSAPAKKADGDNVFDGVAYGLKSTSRNAWLQLVDGRVIEIKSGGRMPEESEIEKRLTKTAFTEAVENGAEVAKAIGEVIDEQAEEVKKSPKKKAAPVEEDDEDEDEEDVDDEDEEDEDEEDEEDDDDEDEEDDEDEVYTVEEVKDLVKAAKEIKGGKKVVKKLLEEYKVKSVAKLDEDDLQDVADELAEFIEENE